MPVHPTVEFVGRVEEWRTITAALDDAARGSGSLLVLTGPSGIGKSLLFDAAVSDAERRGLVIYRAAARRLEQHRPLGVLLDLADGIELDFGGGDPAIRLSADNGAEFVVAEQLADALARQVAGAPFLVGASPLRSTCRRGSPARAALRRGLGRLDV